MASVADVATLEETALERVARLAIAELRPPAAKVRTRRRTPPGRTDRPEAVEASAIALEVKSAAGSAQLSEHDLSRALGVALRTVFGGDDVVVLRGGAAGTDAVVRRLVERLPSMVEARRRTLSEAHIEALVDAYLPADALASVMPDIEADNARVQAEFLSTHPVLSATSSALGERSGWQAAFWFVSANGWLGGVAPIERLDDAEALAAAAAHEAEAWIG